MKLMLNDRDMLIVRMQAWAYENIIQGDMMKAEEHAREVLAQFDYMVGERPADSAGYWAGFYFDRFKQACEG